MAKKIVRYVPQLAVTCLSVALLTACGGNTVREMIAPNTIAVTSNPTGATVHVMGKKMGVTPLTIQQRDVFPVVYPDKAQDLYGKVILRKEGCREYARTVNNTSLSQGIKARLDCGQMSHQRQPMSAPMQSGRMQPMHTQQQAPMQPMHRPTPQQMMQTPQPTPTPAVRERLIRINALHKEGLLTDAEYKAARQRILGAL